MPLRSTLLAAVVLLGWPAAAQAGVDVSRDDASVLKVAPAGLGVAVDVTVTASATAYLVQGANLVTTDPDCSPAPAGAISCTRTPGSPAQAEVQGGDLADRIAAEGGVTLLAFGNEGDDVLRGGDGDDRLWGDDGADDLDGRAASDNLYGGRGADRLDDSGGSAGSDAVFYANDIRDAAPRPEAVAVTMGNGAADDGSPLDGAAGARDDVGPHVEAVTGTVQGDVLTGGADADALRGLAGNDTLTGAGGADTLTGGADADTVQARDGVADRVDCDEPTVQSPGDVAVLDAATVDTDVVRCEDAQRPAAGSPPATARPPTTATGGALPVCPRTIDLSLLPDFDVDTFVAGRMELPVELAGEGWSAQAFVLGDGPEGRQPLLAVSRIARDGDDAPSVARLRLKPESRASALRGRRTLVTVKVLVDAPGCGAGGIEDELELAPTPDGRQTARASRARSLPSAAALRGSTTITVLRGPGYGNYCNDPHAIALSPSVVANCPVPDPPPPRNCEDAVPLSSVVSALSDCWKQPDKKDRPELWQTSTTTTLNGLVVQPLGGTTIRVNTKSYDLSITGAAKLKFAVQVPGEAKPRDVVLGPVAGTYNFQSNQLALGRKELTQATDLVGFPLEGGASLAFFRDRVEADLRLALPKHFGGAQATASVKVPLSGQVTVDALSVRLPRLHAFGFEVADSTLSWATFTDPQTKKVSETWTGSAEVRFPSTGGDAPAPSFAVTMAWTDGRFTRGSVRAQNLRQTFGSTSVLLDRVEGSIAIADPVVVDVSARVAFGPAVPGLQPPELLAVDGTMKYQATSSKGDAGVFELTGGLSFYEKPPGVTEAGLRGQLRYTTDGVLTLEGTSAIGFEQVGVNGRIAALQTLKELEVTGSMTTRVAAVSYASQLTANRRGAAVCFSNVLKGAGFSFSWRTRRVKWLEACGMAEWQKGLRELLKPKAPARPAARAAQVADPTFVVPEGLERVGVRLTGNGRPPLAALVGPGGRFVEPLVRDARAGQTFFLLDDPAAGTWQVRADSPVTLELNQPLAQPRFSATVERGQGRRRKVRYASSGVPAGATITFAEVADGTARTIRRTTATAGDFRFTPADAAARKRTITATVTTPDGDPTGVEAFVARFTAGPAPRPGETGRLAGRITIGSEPVFFEGERRGADVTYRWGSARDADRYEVRVRLSDGRRLVRFVEQPRLTIPDLDRATGVVLRVRGVADDGDAGPWRDFERDAAKVRESKRPAKRYPNPRWVGYVAVAP